MTTTNTSSNDSAASAAMETAVTAMNSGTRLFDVTIVCTTDDHQADYWMERLSAGVCRRSENDTNNTTSSPYPMVLAVSEDWVSGSGAGNGLGTLYAWKKACTLASTKNSVNLEHELSTGSISAALFHTAGKGTRMAPLPASENNNKPGVKLPFPVRMSDGSLDSLTVLEAVVKQTGIYAASRAGRLSVFWGDQVFLPTAPFEYSPAHHADILCTLSDQTVTAEEWKEQGLDKYGVIACIDAAAKGGGGSDSATATATTTTTLDAAQVEKVDHATAQTLLQSLGEIRQVGPSLGSFSLSAAMVTALCDEYSAELSAKTAKLDTDPHFWMPLTLPRASYVRLMGQKGVAGAEAEQHYDRMDAFKAKFVTATADKKMGIFGAVNVGNDARWWDYGQLQLYSKNSLLLLEDDNDDQAGAGAGAGLLRKFLNVSSHQMDCAIDEKAVHVDKTSYLFGSKIKTGSVKRSVLAGVSAGTVNADGAIIVNCAAKNIQAAAGSILYNLVDDSDTGIVAAAGQVLVSVTDQDGNHVELKSRLDIDGGKAWKVKLSDQGNDWSFEDVHKKNKSANIRMIQQKRKENYDRVANGLGF